MNYPYWNINCHLRGKSWEKECVKLILSNISMQILTDWTGKKFPCISTTKIDPIAICNPVTQEPATCPVWIAISYGRRVWTGRKTSRTSSYSIDINKSFLVTQDPWRHTNYLQWNVDYDLCVCVYEYVWRINESYIHKMLVKYEYLMEEV